MPLSTAGMIQACHRFSRWSLRIMFLPSSTTSAVVVRRLVIFDHDGLMVNTEDVVYTAYSRIFGPRNIAFPWDYYVTSLGMPVADSLAMYLRDLGDPMTLAELAQAWAEQMRTLTETDLRPMPGLVALLDALQARGDL